jgi:hypothetical protein
VYTGSRRRAGSLVTGPKNNGHERRSPRTSSVAVTYRDLTWQRSPQGIDATLPIWDLRNQLARARASGTPSLSLLDCVEVLLQRAQSARCPSLDISLSRTTLGGFSAFASGPLLYRDDARLLRTGPRNRKPATRTALADGRGSMILVWR